ncbi:hypothetical protein ACFPVY_14885 [Flavobacterium qiangtangense]|uniref:Lipid A 3-O-deacylase PagL n=1 Tax=Flavobacterium qiangtangense TaxID=1442595 RepID=A0ABW1PS78_9FLAO
MTKNTESYFTDYHSDEVRAKDGLAFDLNTIHGAKFFGYVALSAGFSIDWNINKTFLSTPLIVDVRVFTSRTSENPLFFYLQTGPNIRWSDSFGSNGGTTKGGVGMIFNYDNQVSYYFDFFKKSKVLMIDDATHDGNYHATGYGISLGIQF